MRRLKPKPLAILLTGTPCSGKTTLAKAWCGKNKWVYLPLNELVEKKKLYSRIDKKDGAKIVKLKALEKEANKAIAQTSRPLLAEGHIGCEIKLDVARVLVLRLEPNELIKHLSKRRYSSAKLQENKMAEMLDYCTICSLEQYGSSRVFEMDMSKKTIKQNLASFAKFVSANKSGLRAFLPHVSWSEALLAEV